MEESLNLLYLLLLLLHKVLLVLPVGPDRLLPLLLLLVVLQTRRDGSVQPLQLVLDVRHIWDLHHSSGFLVWNVDKYPHLRNIQFAPRGTRWKRDWSEERWSRG